MKTVTYLLENLCCANCAAKIERKMNDHPQVREAVLTFSTSQLRLTAQEPDALVEELEALARTVEPDLRIRPREEHRHVHDHAEHGHCGCGHDHEERSHCSCGHDHEAHTHCSCGHSYGSSHDHGKEDPRWLLLGAVLFVIGLLTPGWWQIGICFAAFWVLGWGVVRKAVENLLRGHVMDENFLMTVASLGAFFIGNAPEGVGVMLFYRVGEYFEHRAVERSRSQIMDAVDLRPETVNLVLGEEIREIPARDASAGDLLLVRPGDRIPLDGVVVSGESRLDTAPITGEPVPRQVAPGSEVISGCVNTQGQLIIRARKPLEESMVTRILNSVENAAAGKPKIDRFITRFARIYTPVVVAIAAATAVIPSLLTGEWSHWVYTALSFLVMSCPCALVLSVPLAFFAGIGAGSRKGILFKDGAAMEAMSKVRAVVMDKTGTLTRGDFRVQKVEGSPELLELCAACEASSTHPIAVSIVSAAREQGLSWSRPEELEEVPGHGIRAMHHGRRILVGNEKLLLENGISCPKIREKGGTTVLVAVDGVYAGSLLIADTLKEDAPGAVTLLKNRGYATAMLTGDSRESAQAVSEALGIDACYASALPQEKLEILEKVRKEKGSIMFVGDGINDAPVLAGADVGAAMGSGADAAIEAADVVFMTSQVQAIPQALEIAGKTARIAWQNVIFALGIKLIVMVLGLMGYAFMWLAVFADSGVAMLCVLNSIRMLYKK